MAHYLRHELGHPDRSYTFPWNAVRRYIDRQRLDRSRADRQNRQASVGQYKKGSCYALQRTGTCPRGKAHPVNHVKETNTGKGDNRQRNRNGWQTRRTRLPLTFT